MSDNKHLIKMALGMEQRISELENLLRARTEEAERLSEACERFIVSGEKHWQRALDFKNALAALMRSIDANGDGHYGLDEYRAAKKLLGKKR